MCVCVIEYACVCVRVRIDTFLSVTLIYLRDDIYTLLLYKYIYIYVYIYIYIYIQTDTHVHIYIKLIFTSFIPEKYCDIPFCFRALKIVRIKNALSVKFEL